MAVEYFLASSCFSNYSNHRVRLRNGLEFLNAESAYHSQKFSDFNIKRRFLNLSPDDSKQLSRILIEAIDKDFEHNKYNLMKEVVLAKFEQNEGCRQQLLHTNSYLVENTTGWHDNYWGNCNCDKCKEIVGKNSLGNILYEVRLDLLSRTLNGNLEVYNYLVNNLLSRVDRTASYIDVVDNNFVGFIVINHINFTIKTQKVGNGYVYVINNALYNRKQAMQYLKKLVK